MSEQPPRRTWIERNAGALRHNAALLSERAGGVSLLAVIKTNAYGHGMTWAAETLKGQVPGFAVATVEEGIEVRAVAPDHEIVVLGGAIPGQEGVAAAHNLRLTTFDGLGLDRAVAAGVKTAIKVDLGMHRLGFALDDLPEQLPEGAWLMGHLPRADDGDPEQSQPLIATMKRLTHRYPHHPASLAGSAALIRFAQARQEWVRPGLSLYGVEHFAGEGAIGVKPVLSWYARVLQVRDVAPLEYVGYGRHHRLLTASRIAVVGAGYGDGLSRRLGGRGEVVIAGKRYPVVGVVCMDLLMVDVGHDPVKPGATATLIGAGIPVADMALALGTIPYEVLTAIRSRVIRLDR
ncbi:MAG: alanine racemase [Proteobacteria bacterium CG1_02_64_396]|nr:MAG: alanine racemase [Proteobacteria bacterium CG1_02_64_396]